MCLGTTCLLYQPVLHSPSICHLVSALGRRMDCLTDGGSVGVSVAVTLLYPALIWHPCGWVNSRHTVHFKASFHQETVQPLWDSTIQYVEIHHSDYKLKRTGKKTQNFPVPKPSALILAFYLFFCKQTQHFKASCVCFYQDHYCQW